MERIRIFLVLVAVFALPPLFAEEGGLVVDGLLARVGEDTIQYSDLRRYRSVESIMQCVGERIKFPGSEKETVRRALTRYIDEELIYLEARAKMPDGSARFPETIRKIKSFPACHNRWKNLGEQYSQLWSSKANPLAGEGMLVRELEKRLLIDLFAKEKIGVDIKTWLQEARVKVPIKFYTE